MERVEGRGLSKYTDVPKAVSIIGMRKCCWFNRQTEPMCTAGFWILWAFSIKCKWKTSYIIPKALAICALYHFPSEPSWGWRSWNPTVGGMYNPLDAVWSQLTCVLEIHGGFLMSRTLPQSVDLIWNYSGYEESEASWESSSLEGPKCQWFHVVIY